LLRALLFSKPEGAALSSDWEKQISDLVSQINLVTIFLSRAPHLKNKLRTATSGELDG